MKQKLIYVFERKLLGTLWIKFWTLNRNQGFERLDDWVIINGLKHAGTLSCIANPLLYSDKLSCWAVFMTAIPTTKQDSQLHQFRFSILTTSNTPCNTHAKFPFMTQFITIYRFEARLVCVTDSLLKIISIFTNTKNNGEAFLVNIQNQRKCVT